MGGAILLWRDLDDVTEALSNMWENSPALRWAKEAWEHLIRQGLAAYDNESKKAFVKIRFLALAGFYRDFCYIAWGKTCYPSYAVWADMMQIPTGLVVKLAGSALEHDTEEEQETLFVAALGKLIQAARPEVIQGLMIAHDNASGLLVSLWNSRSLHHWTECPFGDERCSECEQSPDQILNWDIEEKGPAYTWLDQGAEEILSE